MNYTLINCLSYVKDNSAEYRHQCSRFTGPENTPIIRSMNNLVLQLRLHLRGMRCGQVRSKWRLASQSRANKRLEKAEGETARELGEALRACIWG